MMEQLERFMLVASGDELTGAALPLLVWQEHCIMEPPEYIIQVHCAMEVSLDVDENMRCAFLRSKGS